MQNGHSQLAPVTVLLGAQWGDEGKGKIIDYLIDTLNIGVTARCQGGNNAGHTVVANGRTYDFHILPSGVISPHCFNVIGNGVVFNIDSFFAEIEKNEIHKREGWQKMIMISREAHIVLSAHQQVDGKQENQLGEKNKIGTTNRGIGPTYATKCFRNGLRMADLMGDFDNFEQRYRRLVEHFRLQFPAIQVDEEGELVKLKEQRERLSSLGLVGDTVNRLHELQRQGRPILVEGANGALLDIDHGTYPFVTSSNATAGGACTGLGLPPTAIKQVIGVVKAYQTRVGTGPMPTELHDETGEKLQQIGKEWGVTTGRKRRCGWVDLFLLRRSARVNGLTHIALTKLDILDTFPLVRACVGYKLDGVELDAPPALAADWDRVECVWADFEGWQANTAGVRHFNDLPQKCRDYVLFIERFVEVPIQWVGVGADRESIISRD